MNKYLVGYSLSVIVAMPVAYYWSSFLHGAVQRLRTESDAEAERVPWIPLTVGVLERAIITTLVGWNVSGSAGFMGAWVAVKSAGGWASWSKGTTYGRSILFVGLLGNAVSILFAVAGGLIVAAPSLSAGADNPVVQQNWLASLTASVETLAVQVWALPMVWFNLIGLVLGIAGTIIILRGELITSAAQIKHFWNDLEKSWKVKKPSWFEKVTCRIAKKFGSDNVLDTCGSTVEDFQKHFWGFTLLFLGFLFQFFAVLIQLSL